MGAAEATFRVERLSDSVVLGKFTSKVDEEFKVPGENISIKFEAFLPDWAQAPNGKFYSRTQRLDNPAAFVTIVDAKGKTLAPDKCCWAFAKDLYRESFKAIMKEKIAKNEIELPYLVELIGMRAPEFTGIQVKRDPGQPVAYLGFLLLVTGISVHLFLKHKMIWVHLGSDRMIIAGMARNHPRQFEEEFARIVSELEKINVESIVLEPVNV
jgi:cytochrome c biogenesis protein